MENDPRFHHHEWLNAVALEDARFLKEKDRSYGASWKLAGGRSAWFMLRRKMDRMIEMMKRPEPPAGFNPNTSLREAGGGIRLENYGHLLAAYRSEDIFGMIESDPSGKDGCVLAEVRDLRRYLLLVEAEMIARNVVDAPGAPLPPVQPPTRLESATMAPPEMMIGSAPNSAAGCEWSTRPGPDDDVVTRAGIG